MTDLEGVSGIIGRSDGIGNRIERIEEAGRLLTEEVNSVVEGVVSGGADTIVVADGHGGSNTILSESLNPKADLVRCSGELFPLTWGLDETFDAALQVGAHAMMGTRDGFLHHSFNSHAITHMDLNGTAIGEIGIIALLASYYSIPTILIAGDRAACREASDFIPGVATVETKIGLNRYSSVDKNPLRVRAELAAAAEKAVARCVADRVPPVRNVDPPYELVTRFMCPNLADTFEKRGAKRIDFLTVSLASDDFVDLWAQRMGWLPGLYEPR